MPGIKPTDAEVELLVDSASLMAWVGMSATPPATPTPAPPTPLMSEAQAYMAFLQSCPTEHYSSMAQLTADDFYKFVTDGYKINGQPPGPVQKGRALQFHVTARRLCNLDPWPAPHGWAAPTAAAATPPPNIPAAYRAGGAALINTPTIKMNQVLDQRMSDEITYISDPSMSKYLERYHKVMEEFPPPHLMASLEQVTALEYIISQNRAPYVDMAIWGPYAVRGQRSRALAGLTMQANGQFCGVEILGPVSIEAWNECYDVLCTVLIMLNAVNRPVLARYREMVNSFHMQFGPKCWALLYQTEMRCRLELMEPIRHQLYLAHERALMAHQPSTYDVSRPWNSVWEHVVSSKQATDYWHKVFETPAILISSGAISAWQPVAGDAPIAQGSGSQPSSSQQPARPPKQPKGPKIIKDTQTTGTQICEKFNQGKCKGQKCPHGRRHVCSVCNKGSHTAAECRNNGKDNGKDNGWNKNNGNRRRGRGNGKKWT